MYISEIDILRAEHNLLTEAVAGAENAPHDFTSGYITGIVALAAELTEEKKVNS